MLCPELLWEQLTIDENLSVLDHPKTPTIYVYLSDAGPVRFKHAGAEPFYL
jgi:hypothetical protein